MLDPRDAEPEDNLGGAPHNPVPRRDIPASPPRGSLLGFLSGHAQMPVDPYRMLGCGCHIVGGVERRARLCRPIGSLLGCAGGQPVYRTISGAGATRLQLASHRVPIL
jgi:hypothetical protein